VPLIVRPPNVDEEILSDEEPRKYVGRICRLKLAAAESDPNRPPQCGAILVADTTVVIEGRILGKPNDDEESLAELFIYI
jgi:septum formation protein